MTEEQFHSRFYGVYLLCSQSPEKKYNGKCYVGFTVNPNRRIQQHNRGKEFGGAKKTNNKGPWKMVMIVHGFPNNIAALQFEWAWQQPALSSRLKIFTELRRKSPKESHFQYNFRILSRMLLVGPWHRLPLHVRWLETDYECDFAVSTLPPPHMRIVSGKIAIAKVSSLASKKKVQSQLPRAIWAPECHMCMQRIDNPERSRIGCLNALCKLTCHLICLANHLISADAAATGASNRGHYIPIAGECPLCETQLVWAELLQRKRRMQGDAVEEDEDFVDDDYDDDELENHFGASDDDNDDDVASSDEADAVVCELSD